jgi:hypothetical protein
MFDQADDELVTPDMNNRRRMTSDRDDIGRSQAPTAVEQPELRR